MFMASAAATILSILHRKSDGVSIVAMFGAASAVLVGVMAMQQSWAIRFSLPDIESGEYI